MKKYWVMLFLLSSCILTACDNTASQPSKTNTRAISIAGMPVADQDFRLNPQLQANDLQH